MVVISEETRQERKHTPPEDLQQWAREVEVLKVPHTNEIFNDRREISNAQERQKKTRVYVASDFPIANQAIANTCVGNHNLNLQLLG